MIEFSEDSNKADCYKDVSNVGIRESLKQSLRQGHGSLGNSSFQGPESDSSLGCLHIHSIYFSKEIPSILRKKVNYLHFCCFYRGGGYTFSDRILDPSHISSSFICDRP